MSFLDKAKAAAQDLQAKADTALSNAGLSGPPGVGGVGSASGPGAPGRGIDLALRDFGLLAWREQHGGAVDPADRQRVVAALDSFESAGQLSSLRVTPAGPVPGAPPPPPGAVAAAAQAAQAVPPPPPGMAPPAPSAPPATPDPTAAPDIAPSGSTPPPPPPSWA